MSLESGIHILGSRITIWDLESHGFRDLESEDHLESFTWGEIILTKLYTGLWQKQKLQYMDV